MRNFVTVLLTTALFLCATTAMATSFYYEASNVTGLATLTYDTDGVFAPEFTFAGDVGTVSTDLYYFVPGSYTVSVTLNGFWADYNNDGAVDYNLPDVSGTVGPLTIPLVPLAGTYGSLSWDVDLSSGFWLSYDFGDTGDYTNLNVSQYLAGIDYLVSGASNGVMDAIIGWDTFRVDLTSAAPVPEPSTIILLGAGIAGLAIYRRKKNS